MQQLIKRYCWVALLVASAPVSWGFALLGPRTDQAGLPGFYGDTWEVPTIGYDLAGDIGTPKNIGEGYRRNTPILYYAYDEQFSQFFGSNGEAAVDSAIAIMNSVLPVDQYTPGLYEMPMNSQIYDTTAEALGLTDLKSYALVMLVEQMGLAEPERYTWTLHDRYLPGGGTCPADELYLVVQRNFDPITSPLTQAQYSYYVNGTMYSYEIGEACTGANPLALAIPFSPDIYAPTYTAVAGQGVGYGVVTGIGNGNLNWGSIVGGVYQGLTRDDVAGMRYLYSTNNVEYESAALGSSLYTTATNTSTQALFPNGVITNVITVTGGTNVVTGTNGFGYFYYYDGTYGYGDYAQLLQLSQISSPAVLQALYPGLVVATSSNYFILATNITAGFYFTNIPGQPYNGGNPTTVIYYTTNYYPLELYSNTFANVVLNHFWSSNSVYTLVTNTVGPQPGKPWGTIYTNITSGVVVQTNLAAADFFVFPEFYTNVCPLDIDYTIQTNIWRYTNAVSLLTVSNITVVNGVTNTSGGTLSYSSSVSAVFAFTNYSWVTYPVTCTVTTNATGWYQGIGHVQFVREPDTSLVDPLTDIFVTPITNNYTMVSYTNNAFVTQYFQRIVLAPDVLFDTSDLASPNKPVAEIGVGSVLRNLNFNVSNILPAGAGNPGVGLAGPGTIDTPTIMSFNRVGNVYGNGSLAADVTELGTLGTLSQYSQVSLLAWGSFDGTTNAPVVYPNGTSIQNIESELIVSLNWTAGTNAASSALALPNGTKGVSYVGGAGVQFAATGGVAPYAWSLVSGGGSLPAGLSFTSAGLLGGTVTTNALSGTYDFTIQVTDSANRVVDFPNYTITIP